MGSTVTDPASGLRTSTSFSYLTFERFRDNNDTLADVFAFASLSQLNVGLDGQAEIATGQFGVAIGLGATVATTRLVAAMLFGLTPTDPLTILFVVVLMIAVAALAGYIPARRAAGVDPINALRYE